MDQTPTVQPAANANAVAATTPPPNPEPGKIQLKPEGEPPQNVSRETITPKSGTNGDAKLKEEPLSPRFAKLASTDANLRKRALEIRDKEKQLEERMKGAVTTEDWRKRAASDPVGTAKELGISYEALTKALLNDGKTTPDQVYENLQGEIKGLKEELNKYRTETENKELTAQERAWKNDVKNFAATNIEKYELSQSIGVPVEDLVHSTVLKNYNESKKMLRSDEALDLIESNVDNQLRVLLNTKKGQAIAREILGATTKPAEPPKSPSPTLTNVVASIQQTPRDRLLNRDESLAEAAKLLKHR